MTELKLWYSMLNPAQKTEFRESVMNNDIEMKVSLSSFFRFLEEKHAPAPVQTLISKLTGIQKENLYKVV